MAKKSKTQRAKASAARQARKVQAAELEAKGISAEEVEAQKKAEAAKQEKKAVEKAKPKKQRFKFLKRFALSLNALRGPREMKSFVGRVLSWVRCCSSASSSLCSITSLLRRSS